VDFKQMLSALKGFDGEDVALHLVTMLGHRELEGSRYVRRGRLSVGLDAVAVENLGSSRTVFVWTRREGAVSVVLRRVMTGQAIVFLSLWRDAFLDSEWLEAEGRSSFRIRFTYATYTVIPTSRGDVASRPLPTKRRCRYS
jgi:hypothetical protein